MHCKFGHPHPPHKLVAATYNPTKPWGPRPYHCPDCAHVSKTQAVPGNWISHPSIAEAIKKGHPRGCKHCFP